VPPPPLLQALQDDRVQAVQLFQQQAKSLEAAAAALQEDIQSSRQRVSNATLVTLSWTRGSSTHSLASRCLSSASCCNDGVEILKRAHISNLPVAGPHEASLRAEAVCVEPSGCNTCTQSADSAG
jgi:hypothetical protein